MFIITDSLNRKWSIIGINVSDAIQVFEQGNGNVWTHIIEPEPFNSYLTINDLINILNLGPDVRDIRNTLQIMLNNVERRNAFLKSNCKC